MKEFVVFEAPELMRYSLILTGLTFLTFSVADSECVFPLEPVQERLATRSPLKAAGPEVTLKVALTLAPGATGPANVFEVWLASPTTVHCLGAEILNWTPVAGAPVVFVNVTVASCDD